VGKVAPGIGSGTPRAGACWGRLTPAGEDGEGHDVLGDGPAHQVRLVVGHRDGDVGGRPLYLGAYPCLLAAAHHGEHPHPHAHDNRLLPLAARAPMG